MTSVPTTVAVVRCAGYAPGTVGQAVADALELLGGAKRFIDPGRRILIKPNLIAPVGPDIPAQTHPEVICAVAEWVKRAGVFPSICR